jgi:hypothetical protein
MPAIISNVASNRNFFVKWETSACERQLSLTPAFKPV